MSTSSSPDVPFEQRPLAVLALGGNALSPPEHDVDDYAVERAIVERTATDLRTLIQGGYRLLIVHGNGPQVGRLLKSDADSGDLDIHVAQTQGELGYLLAAALADSPVACILTRVTVAGELGPPVKPIGPILKSQPSSVTATRTLDGWRIVVPSPRPSGVIESDAIAHLLQTHHVIAGGGGGVPIANGGEPLNCVVDKDWVASLLAVSLDAAHLVFATNVEGVYDEYGAPGSRLVHTLYVDEARERLDRGDVAPGSMGPKLASAVDFVAATGKAANICSLAALARVLEQHSGTLVSVRK